VARQAPSMTTMRVPAGRRRSALISAQRIVTGDLLRGEQCALRQMGGEVHGAPLALQRRNGADLCLQACLIDPAGGESPIESPLRFDDPATERLLGAESCSTPWAPWEAPRRQIEMHAVLRASGSQSALRRLAHLSDSQHAAEKKMVLSTRPLPTMRAAATRSFGGANHNLRPTQQKISAIVAARILLFMRALP
jgi:hypothetical protein